MSNNKLAKAKSVVKRPTLTHYQNFRIHNGLKSIHTILESLPKGDDEKRPDNKLWLAQELGLLKVMRSMLRVNAIYRFQIGFGGGATGAYYPTSSTLGVLAIAQNLVSNLTAASDWSGLAALFDEFTLDSSTFHLIPQNPGFNIASPGMTAVAFDDDGGTSSSTIISGGYDILSGYPTLSTHCPALQGSTLATQANSTGFKPLTLTFKRPFPPGDHDPVVNAPTSGWVDIATPSNFLGSILLYNNSVSASNAVNCYQYMCIMQVRMRARR